jgi:queuosine precursor transporter
MSAVLIAIYIAAMVTANLLVWWLGPWFSPINAFVLIGLDLTMRDVLHERLDRWQLAAVVLAGGAITWGVNPAASMIAIASATAFIAAAVADWLVYAALRSYPWLMRSNASNAVGAAVDSVLFPTIAFGTFMPAIIGLQFLAKVGGGAVWSLAMAPMLRFERK